MSLSFEHIYKKNSDAIALTVSELLSSNADPDAHNQVALITAAMSGLLAMNHSEGSFYGPSRETKKYSNSDLVVYPGMVKLKRAASPLNTKAKKYVFNASTGALNSGYPSESQRKLAQSFIKATVI